VELLRAHIYKEDNVLFNMADFMVEKPACQKLCAQYDVVCARHFEGSTKEELETLAGNLLNRFGHP
jgi:hemerythrin-like domain-containing protein